MYFLILELEGDAYNDPSSKAASHNSAMLEISFHEYSIDASEN